MTLVFNWATGTFYTTEDGEALTESEVNSISSVAEAGTTCALTITRNHTN